MHIKEMDQILKNNKNSHSDFQIQFFLIGSEPTHQARIHQCLMELHMRKKTLENLDLEIAEVNDKKTLLEIKLNEKKPKNNKEKEIKERMANRRIVYLDKRILELEETKKNIESEADIIIKIYKQLIEVEPEKDWNSSEVQLEYWNAKLLRDIRIRAITGQRLDIDLAKTVFSLPDGIPVKKIMCDELLKKNIGSKDVSSESSLKTIDIDNNGKN